MRDVITTVYKFGELSEEAREQAIEHYRDVNVDDDLWFEQMTEVRTGGLHQGMFQEKAARSGFEMTEFYFSGFYNQGDGASFEASVDIETFIRAHKLGNRYRRVLEATRKDVSLYGEIECHSSHYYHANTMTADLNSDYNTDGEFTEDQEIAFLDELRDLEEVVQEKARGLANEFYRTLESAFDYLRTDAVVIDWIKANEIEFTITGEAV